MTTPTGTIKFSDITAEFGSSPNNKLGEYRVSQAVAGRSWPLDDGVPSSGTIKFSDLKGKTLNVVVDYSTESTRVDSGTTYDNSGSVIGGFKTKPSREDSTQTKKVRNIIRATLGVSSSQSTTDVALRTGIWSSSTALQYIITTSGKIYGRGGLGGNSSSPIGESGSPAFGVENNCSIIIETSNGSSGEIRGGGGGGGKGGNYSFNQNAIIGNYACSGTGGSGGTGAGYNNQNGPSEGTRGVGGPGGRCTGPSDPCGSNGSANGGGAGHGGTGGEWGSNGNPGCNAGTTGPIGGESESIGSGSDGGLGGAAIIKSSNDITVNISNSGNNNISGSTSAVGAFS